MSTSCYSHKPSKRPPGRPAGSAPYKAEDEALLRKAACALVENNALTLTAVLRACDVTREKDLARLRARWRQVGPAFLDDARRNPAAPPVRDSLLLLSSLVAGFADRATNSVDAQKLQEALARCRQELRSKSAASLTDVTTIFWAMHDGSDHGTGISMPKLPGLIGDRTTAHGMSDGDLLFLWARLCDREAIAAWAREERLNDDQDPTD